MKNLKLHSQNLCSIEDVTHDYDGKIIFFFVIEKLLSLAKGGLYLEASRPTYEYETIDIDNALKENNIEFKSKNSSLFEFNFFTNYYKNQQELKYLLFKIWFAYEHCTIVFISQDRNYNQTSRSSWKTITESIDSFVVFRGVESEVLWVGKSDKLDFNLMND